MIQLTKTYTTADGKPVKLALISADRVQGYFENAPNEWVPWTWSSEDGTDYGSASFDVHLDQNIANKTLKEVKPRKQVSVTMYVLQDGSCKKANTMTEAEQSTYFAKFTVNVEVEEGSSKVYILKQENP